MLLSKEGREVSYQAAVKCFNPYFSGCFSLRYNCAIEGVGKNQFQSLFFWMLLSKLQALVDAFQVCIRVSILIFLDASL